MEKKHFFLTDTETYCKTRVIITVELVLENKKQFKHWNRKESLETNPQIWELSIWWLSVGRINYSIYAWGKEVTIWKKIKK